MDSLIVFKFAADNITDDAAVVNGTAFLSGGVAGKIAADAVDYAFIIVVTVIKNRAALSGGGIVVKRGAEIFDMSLILNRTAVIIAVNARRGAADGIVSV